MTEVHVVYTANRAGITFSLQPVEREKFPAGSSRIFLAFNEAPSLALLSPADTKAIGSLLTRLPENELDVKFVQVC